MGSKANWAVMELRTQRPFIGAQHYVWSENSWGEMLPASTKERVPRKARNYSRAGNEVKRIVLLSVRAEWRWSVFFSVSLSLMSCVSYLCLCLSFCLSVEVVCFLWVWCCVWDHLVLFWEKENRFIDWHTPRERGCVYFPEFELWVWNCVGQPAVVATWAKFSSCFVSFSLSLSLSLCMCVYLVEILEEAKHWLKTQNAHLKNILPLSRQWKKPRLWNEIISNGDGSFNSNRETRIVAHSPFCLKQGCFKNTCKSIHYFPSAMQKKKKVNK